MVWNIKSVAIKTLKASKAKTDSNNLAFVTTFNSNSKNVSPLIETVFKPLQKLYETKECLKDIKLIKSKSKPFNLKNLLARAKYSNKEDHYRTKCNKPKCAYCGCIKEGSFHTFKTTGNIFHTKEDMTCESGNLVSVVISSTCNEKYIGDTEEGKTRL